jgi:hypothetical protein
MTFVLNGRELDSSFAGLDTSPLALSTR